jgi:predicted SAM-dependent methyltransferase
MPEPSPTEQLRGLGTVVEELAAELVAYSAMRDPGPSDAVGAAMADTLHGAWVDVITGYHDLAGVLSRLATLREAYLERQVAALQLGPDPRGLLLSLTGHAPAPWITVGFPPARIVMSLRWGLPFRDGSAHRVYFALALEHFYYEHDALAVLRDVRRVLAPGGVLRIVVPDLEKYVRAYAAGDDAFFTAHKRFWSWAERMHTPMDYLQGMSGSGMGRGSGGFFDHKMGYDFATLSRLLRDAGFAAIERRDYMQSEHVELRIDHVSHDASFGHDGQNFNLFVECTT